MYLLIDYVIDHIYNMDDSLVEEEQIDIEYLKCYLLIGESIYRFSVLENMKKPYRTEERHAITHGYWVLDIVNNKSTYSLCRYESGNKLAKFYNIDEIKAINYRLRDETKEFEEKKEVDLGFLYQYLIVIGEFTLEFSHLILNIMTYLKYCTLINPEVEFLDKLHIKDLIEKAKINSSKSQVEILEKCLQLNKKRSIILHSCFSMKSNSIGLVEDAIKECKELQKKVL